MGCRSPRHAGSGVLGDSYAPRGRPQATKKPVITGTGVDILRYICPVLFVFAASANVFVAYGKLRWFYRCPRCRARVPRVPESEAGSRIRYRCAACGVEWDTGWDEVDSD